MAVFSQYRETLSADRRALFDRYRFVDFARKVVGVGSVGTRCWIGAVPGTQRWPAVPPGEGSPAVGDRNSRSAPGHERCTTGNGWSRGSGCCRPRAT